VVYHLILFYLTMPEMFKEYLDPRTVLSDNVSGFKTFINRKKIKITNDNVEDVPTIEYRLYKDSKFFGRLRDVIGDYDAKELINRWLEFL